MERHAPSATPASAAQPAETRAPGRSRRILSGIALVLACLTILVTTVAVWRTRSCSTRIASPRSSARSSTSRPSSTRLPRRSARRSSRGSTSRPGSNSRLPDAVKSLAAPLTLAFGDALEKRLQVALRDSRIQTALVRTVSFAHARVMNLLRDKPESVSVVDGYIVIDVFPVVGAALAELQANGIIPADVQLPDLSNPEAPGVLAGRVESALGVTLPDDFGTIRLMPADRILAARSVVRIFDLLVIMLIVLSLLLVALALWLARDRRRMVLYLAIGTLIVFLLARLATNAITNALVGGIADQGLSGAVRTVLDATIADLRSLTAIILVGTAILAVAAYIWGRPAWLTSAAGQVGSSAGRAGWALAAGTAGVGAAASSTPSRASVEDTVRDNRATVERAGIAVIVFIVAWIALGLGIALVGAALVIGFELVLRGMGSDEGDQSGVAAEGAPAPVPAATPAPEPAPVLAPSPRPSPPRTWPARRRRLRRSPDRDRRVAARRPEPRGAPIAPRYRQLRRRRSWWTSPGRGCPRRCFRTRRRR